MSLSIIVAMGKNGEIGVNNTLPWNIPEDMKRFRKLTIGKPVVMGRRTYESLPENFRPLPGRKNIVVTKSSDFIERYIGKGVVFTHDINTALVIAGMHGTETYVIGGGQIYEQTIGQAGKLEITHIKGNYQGDVYFPRINMDDWRVDKREDRIGYSFVTYLRRYQNA